MVWGLVAVAVDRVTPAEKKSAETGEKEAVPWSVLVCCPVPRDVPTSTLVFMAQVAASTRAGNGTTVALTEVFTPFAVRPKVSLDQEYPALPAKFTPWYRSS